MTIEVTARFQVGDRICKMKIASVDLQPGARVLQTTWTPNPPAKFTPQILEEYRRGRDALYAAMATYAETAALVLEVNEDDEAQLRRTVVQPAQRDVDFANNEIGL